MSPRTLQVGLDSLGAVELRSAITAALGITLPATSTFDHPTVAALAAFVASKMGPAAPVEDRGMRYDLPAGASDGSMAGGRLRLTDIMSVSLTYPSAQTGGKLPALSRRAAGVQQRSNYSCALPYSLLYGTGRQVECGSHVQ